MSRHEKSGMRPLRAEWGVAACEHTYPHAPHQVMEYEGTDDTYDLWCLGVLL